MRKIILSVATSLDGYIEGPNREVDWMVFTEDTAKALGDFITEIDTILYGRVSYEAWGNYTPPDDAPFEKDFYTQTAQMRKYVFSTATTAFEGSPTVIQSNVAEAMQQLKQQPGKNIWLYGGAQLISEFVNLNLIDEFRIAVMPIILGKGNPLFKDIQNRVSLTLLKTIPSNEGVIELHYGKANH